MKNIYSILIVLALASLDSKAQKFFMKINSPDIQGDATLDKHVNEINVLSFDYEIENDQNMPRNGSAEGKSRATLVSVTIPSGRASSKLFQAVTSGQEYEKVIIYAVKILNQTTEENEIYATFEFGDVKFSSVSTNPTEGEDFNRAKIGFKAGKYTIKHKAANDPSGYSWNFLTNSPF